MCDKCQQLESTIQHYRRLVAQCLDRATIERVTASIQEMRQRKEMIQH
jgi:hypothetical protein